MDRASASSLIVRSRRELGRCAPRSAPGATDERRLFLAWQRDGDELAREQLVERYMPLARGCPGRRGTLMMAARVNLLDGDERSGLLGDVCGGGLGDLAFDSKGELGEAVVADDPSELLLSLDHPGGSPA